MKKKIALSLLFGLFLITTPVASAEEVTSQATITFVQKTNANQTIPMTRVEVPTPPTATSKAINAPFRFFPKTNEATGQFWFILGVVFFYIHWLFYLKKKTKKYSGLIF